MQLPDAAHRRNLCCPFSLPLPRPHQARQAPAAPPAACDPPTLILDLRGRAFRSEVELFEALYSTLPDMPPWCGRNIDAWDEVLMWRRLQPNLGRAGSDHHQGGRGGPGRGGRRQARAVLQQDVRAPLANRWGQLVEEGVEAIWQGQETVGGPSGDTAGGLSWPE